MMLQSFIILAGSVMLGGFAQEGASTRVHNECRSYPVVKTFNLRDPTTNERCTLEIHNAICVGFCESETENIAIDRQSDAYRLLPVASCECCEPIRKPLLHIFPAMTFTCVEGQKWNQTLKLSLNNNRCHCRTCRSSSTVN